MTAEKLDVVITVVEMEIEVAAALGAFQQARENAGFLRNRGALVAGSFYKPLHLFPCRPVNDGLVDVEEDRPVFLRVFNAAFYLVGFGIAFEVDDIAAVFLQAEDFPNSGMAPFGRPSHTVCPSAEPRPPRQ